MKFPLIAYIEVASNTLPIVAGIIRRNHVQRSTAVLLAYVVFTLAIELWTFYLALQRVNNLWVLHIYTLVEFILMAVVFSLYDEMRGYRRYVPGVIGSYAAIWISCKIFLESFAGFDNYSSPPANIILVLVALRALFVLARTAEAALWRVSLFWFSVAVLVKFAGDFTLFLFGDWFISLGLSEGMTVWTLHWTINILSNIGFTFAILCQSRTPAHSGSS